MTKPEKQRRHIVELYRKAPGASAAAREAWVLGACGLDVSASSVREWVALADAGLSLAPAVASGKSSKLQAPQVDSILNLLKERNDSYLAEFAARVETDTATRVCPETVRQYFTRSHVTHKISIPRKLLTAVDQELYNRYVGFCRTENMLNAWLGDEVSFDVNDFCRRRAWSERGAYWFAILLHRDRTPAHLFLQALRPIESRNTATVAAFSVSQRLFL
jgi:transposase